MRAFLGGAWILYWTDDTLYWAAKPTVHVDRSNGQRTLHNGDGPALESDIENLYFWHGVLVPAFVVTRPEWITIDHIRNEENAEVRRVMIERMGWERFCECSKLKVIHRDEMTSNFPEVPSSQGPFYLDDDGVFRDEDGNEVTEWVRHSATVSAEQRLATRYRQGTEVAELLESEEFKDFEDRPLKFVRITDPSTGEHYVLRVWANNKRAYEAVAQTFGMKEKEYKETVYSHS